MSSASLRLDSNCLSLTKCLDKALHQHYIQHKRDDYIDNDGIGLFLHFLQEQDYGTDEIEDELDDDIEDCGLLEFDPNFPMTSTATDSRQVIFELLNSYRQKHNAQKCAMSNCTLNHSDPNNSSRTLFTPRFVSNSDHIDTSLAVCDSMTLENLSNGHLSPKYSRCSDKSDSSNSTTINGPISPPALSPVSTQMNEVTTSNSQCLPLMEYIDRGLQSIYRQKGLEYLNEDGIGKFEEYCDVNGFDDEGIIVELDPEDKDQCMLVDFDSEFPFDGRECDRNHSIFDMLYDQYQKYKNGDSNTMTSDFKEEEEVYGDGDPLVAAEPTESSDDSDDCKYPEKLDELNTINPNQSIMDRICHRMDCYFKHHDVKYNGFISTFCSEQGLEDLESAEDYKEDIIDMILPIFPFSEDMHRMNQNEKCEFIWSLIESFSIHSDSHYVHPAKPGKLPQEIHTIIFMRRLFDSITETDFKRARARYEAQCHSMWRREMQIDHGFMYALTVGDKYGFPFLQYLVDDYLCTKANRQKFPNGLSVRDWAAEHNRYLKTLKDHNVKVRLEWMESFEDINDDEKGTGDRGTLLDEMQVIDRLAFEIMVHAVISWSKRVVQDWKTTQYRIDDSMEEVMAMFDAHVQWVHNLGGFHWEQTACPMQIDISFVFDKERVKYKGLSFGCHVLSFSE